ncbi:MAG: DUF3857 domain-containing protein [Syntrophothermus sp.]
MKKLVFLSILISFSFSLFAQDENYDAVYNKLTKVYTLNPDGSMDYRYSKELKLQTYRAFHNLYGETFIVYNPAYQQLKVARVQTIMADGKKVNAPANAFNEVLPGWAANAPYYNGLREMVVTHPATERKAVLLIDYTIHTNTGYYPALMGTEMLCENEPVKDLTLKVRVPAVMKLNYRMINSAMAPAISQEEGFQVYTWNLKDVPAISAEDNQKGGNDLYPRVIFSTVKDRSTVYTGFLSQKAFSPAADADMKKAVSEVLAANKEPYDIILKLQDKVVNDLRLWPIPMQYTGYTARPPAETWKSNGGTVPEKAILLTALLKEAGIDAEIAGVVKTSSFDENVGTLTDLEDLLVVARARELEPIYLSVSKINSQSMIYGLPERVLVTLNPAKKPLAIKTEDYKNKITLSTRFVMTDKQQLEGEVAGYFYNNSTPWLSQLRDQVKMKSLFNGGITGADLKELKVITTGPVEGYVRYSATKEKPFKKDSSFYFYTLPAVNSGIDSWGIKLLPKNRVTPLEIPSEMEEKYDFTLDAAGMKLFNTGKPVSIRNNCGSFLYEVKQDGSKLIIKKSIQLSKRIISPDDYANFKELMDNWNNSRTREIVLVLQPKG